MGRVSPWACVPVASREEAGQWRGQSLQIYDLRRDQGAVRTAVRAIPAGLRSQGCHCVTSQVAWPCAGTWSGTTWHMTWHDVGPVRGRRVCGAALARVASRTPSLPLRGPVLTAPASPAPGEGGSMAAALWTSLRQATLGQLPGGGRARPGPAVQALGTSLGRADSPGLREALLAATPRRDPWREPSGASSLPEPQVLAVYLAGAGGAAPQGAASGDVNPQRSWARPHPRQAGPRQGETKGAGAARPLDRSPRSPRPPACRADSCLQRN